MRFKQWLEDGTGSALYGGMVPAHISNSNMPYGVRSKWATKEDGAEDEVPDMIKPEKTFGFQAPASRKRAAERSSKIIHKSRKVVPIRDDRPDIIY